MFCQDSMFNSYRVDSKVVVMLCWVRLLATSTGFAGTENVCEKLAGGPSSSCYLK